MRRRALKLAFVLTLVLIMGAGVAVAMLLNLRVPGVDGAQNDEERILNIARFIARTYDSRPPGSEFFSILYLWRLPGTVRLRTGILETLTHANDCDSMVRALVFLVAREGIEARESNIFAPTFVHPSPKSSSTAGGSWSIHTLV
jgi:hypothetical protein